ncbi:DUF6226 family protein [Streptomyces kunmingensis]|uniref:DUF6226 family protein n=1 Tax=Streptomyces kunmingensis TaxID=68225 RepID=A0ABU6CR60_9ACTN|nr:DUF6226 family protein [Streptomyces kunmingensis]MEB3966870.1 DUF6226 family protein [Streptomyces kunmingensis]
MDHSVLRGAVDEAFAVTGADTPPWPDPHPDGEVRDEEYTRCTKPEKYRILAARAQAWTRALCGPGLAEAEPAAAPAALWRRAGDRALGGAVRLRPVRAGAAPLIFGFAAVDGVPRTVLVIGAGEPAKTLGALPDCGCDACDDGSEQLIEAVDDLVLAVVTGTFVHIDAGRGREIVATGDERSASDWDDVRDPVEEAVAAARAGHSPYEVVQGQAWGVPGATPRPPAAGSAVREG